jgi:hypothetical protein
MTDDHEDDAFAEPTPAERAEAEALRGYLAGTARAPSESLAGAVGLIREAGAADVVVRDAGWRRARTQLSRRRAFWPVAVSASLAAAAVILLFLWPRPPALPPGPSADQLAAAVRVLSTQAPLPERLGTLHAVAGAARRRLLAQISQAEAHAAAESSTRTASGRPSALIAVIDARASR